MDLWPLPRSSIFEGSNYEAIYLNAIAVVGLRIFGNLLGHQLVILVLDISHYILKMEFCNLSFAELVFGIYSETICFRACPR